MPGSVLAMAQARIESLEPEARQVLRAASIFGPVFWRSPVRELLEGGTTRVDDWLQELVRRELVVERRQTRFPGEPELSFRHGLIREAAYAMLTESDRTWSFLCRTASGSPSTIPAARRRACASIANGAPTLIGSPLPIQTSTSWAASCAITS